jgi:hypothetical protein
LLVLATGLTLFGVGCGGDGGTGLPAPGGIDIRVVTGGPEPDPDGYTVSVDDWAGGPIGINDSRYYEEIEPGEHMVELGGLAANCTVTGANPRTVTVAPGESVTVEFLVTCSATTGSLRVTSTTSGPSPDADGYTLVLDGTDRGAIGVNETVTLAALVPGAHQVGLSGLAANCTVEGENPRGVSIVAGEEASVSFAVTCVPPPPISGTLQVTTTTTGEDLDPDGYRVRVDEATGQPIGLNATLSVPNLAAGEHSVRLVNVAANCTVAGENPRIVTILAGATAQVSFAISCAPKTGTIQVTTTTTGTDLDPDGYLVTLGQQTPVAIAATGSHTFESVAPGLHQVALSGLAGNCLLDGTTPREVTVTAGATATVAFTVTCAPAIRWTPMVSPTGTEYYDVAGSSATNVFVTGAYGILHHYDGASWSPQSVPGYGGAHHVSANPAGDAFGLGFGEVFHYDGQQWMRLPPLPCSECSAPGEGPDEVVTWPGGLWSSSANGLFVVGSLWSGGEYPLGPYAAHYDGTAWSQMTVPEMTGVPTGCLVLRDVWGTSAQDVYAVGSYEIPQNGECYHGDEETPPSEYLGVVLHYDGRVWREVLRDPDRIFSNVWASSGSDVYVSGWGRVWHFDGSRWSALATPLSASGAIWGSSASDIFFVVGGAIWHFDGQRWTKTYEGTNPLWAIWGSSANDIFVVGGSLPGQPLSGIILHGTR